jgi:hypothetical protein
MLLISLAGYLTSCYSEKNLSKDDIQSDQRIIAVVYPSGKTINFDDNGAKLIDSYESIEGVADDSESYTLKLEDISQLRTRVYPAKLDRLEGEKIIEAVSGNNTLYTFDKEGGFYEKENDLIIGNEIKLGKAYLKREKIKWAYTSKPETVSLQDLRKDTTLRIAQVIYSNNRAVTFNRDGGRYHLSKYSIAGISNYGEYVVINPDEILYAKIKKSDAAKTTFAILGGCVGSVLVIAAIIAATKESCPFVYSFDGEKYVFDAEPLGGATTKGLQRQEYSRLDYIKEVGGKYKLRVTNEVNETQYVDEMSLLLVDHPKNTEAVINNDGKIYLAKNVESFFSATDENGKDISPFLIKEDNIFWQDKMPARGTNNKIRNHLTFAFKRPHSDSINLIINAGTTLWGSNMIREMLALYGKNLNAWYEKIDRHGMEYFQMMSFLQREELYELKLYLKEKNEWVEKSIIKGGGPFVSETRIIPIDISHAVGDTIFLKVNPPVGFWTFDYLALDFTDQLKSESVEIKALNAVDYHGKYITNILDKEDSLYYQMPETGNYFDIEFQAPAKQENFKRTVFLKSSGYYDIHLPKTDPPNLKMLFEIGTEPGRIVEYSNQKYSEWYNQFSSK